VRARPRIPGKQNPAIEQGNPDPQVANARQVVPEQLAKGAQDSKKQMEARAFAAKKAMRGTTWKVSKNNNANQTHRDPCTGITTSDPEDEDA
jgi:hypothetical protein